METQTHRETSRQPQRQIFSDEATSQGLLAATESWKSLRSPPSPMSTRVSALQAPALCEDTLPWC